MPMRADLLTIPPGRFAMGSDSYYPEERPARTVEVSGFRIARNAVTNAEFAQFVAETGHMTTAEEPLDPLIHPGMPPEFYRPGSLVFRPSEGRVPLHDPRRWWALVEGACWRHPEGPGSSIADRSDHPVVHVSWHDACAYATWARLRLPTEIEWEWAAGGGQSATYPWGETLDPGDGVPANIWLGAFPWQNERHSGPPFSTPVGQFPPNGFNLYDAIGNVWEWTASPFDRSAATGPCCSPSRGEPVDGIRVLAIKGGSFLCAECYCRRYRPAARLPQEETASASNIGFRCAADA
ncbi:formylglycine-generating enzyme family protein [Palleronia rufa]|uniref:formylglycine-generating enzyme family protein n=1 Tax=Palleronia rufa TaxID=1530186 RepID=UPI00190F508F|nr:formylglycine-generating enzyme family protein [Palleronia rufa]